MPAFQEPIPAGPATPVLPALQTADDPHYAVLVEAGKAAFYNACTLCHDPDKSLSKRKSPAQWRATVERMAAKDDGESHS